MLRFIARCWLALFAPCGQRSEGIDTHKWESKVEILGHLSSRRCWLPTVASYRSPLPCLCTIQPVVCLAKTRFLHPWLAP